jgi:hypothetical protein
MAAIGYGIILKVTEHTDKCSNKKTRKIQRENEKTTDKYFFKIL